MSTEQDRLEEIEAKATFAAQLAQMTFMGLINSNRLDPTEANLKLEEAIRTNRKGNPMHQRVAKQFELLRQGLFPGGKAPPEVE
jgi:hypothetical protein